MFGESGGKDLFGRKEDARLQILALAYPWGPGVAPDQYNLAPQRSIGLERHSQIADPKFVDPAKQDFRLQPDSPARNLGFEPIDMTRIGPKTRLQSATRRIP
jgi:hypothetical protein